MKYIATINDTTYQIELLGDNNVRVNGELYYIDSADIAPNVRSLIIENRSHETVVVKAEKDLYDVVLSGEQHQVLVQDELTWRVSQAQAQADAAMGVVTVKSPMPGLIVNVPVNVGDTVAKGDTLIILESMKMENELKSPRDGIVEAVHTEQGASVEKNQKLVTVGDPDTAEDA